MKSLAKAGLRLLLGPYSLYRILASVPTETPGAAEVELLDGDVVRTCGDAYLAEQAWYAGPDCEAYGLRRQGALAAVCFYWHGARYATERGFWPLDEGEAKLVQIATAPSFRGQGLATELIRASANAMQARGWRTLYARVWHSHDASRRAFEKAGWRDVARVVEVDPLRRGRPYRLRWRKAR